MPRIVDGLQKKWIVADRTEPDLVRHVLLARGFGVDFLDVSYLDGLHDPYLMKDMGVAVERLTQAIQKRETIGIYADYDTDGTPGAALLFDGLRLLGAKTLVYIPTRLEGYGVTAQGVESLAAAGARIIITIDVGITAKVPAARAKELGVDFIVTDHHVIQSELFPTDAFAVVNPKQSDCAYPFKELCGGGIIWKIYAALVEHLEQKAPELLNGRSADSLIRWSLDFAAISTICDMVPLVGENRILARYGLKVLAKTRRPGLLALYKVAGIDPDKLAASTVGFQIGPRINAPTRMAAEAYVTDWLAPQGSPALALLLADNLEEASELAGQLNGYNQERQAELERVLAEAFLMIERDRLYEQPVILAAAAGWPAGIVGLVAGRVMEKYGRPTIILGIDGDHATGSARSIDGYHLVNALSVQAQFMEKFGGHAKAAGLTLAKENLKGLYAGLLADVENLPGLDQLGSKLHLEAELTADDLKLSVAEGLEQLAPHGIGNPRPAFMLAGVQLEESRAVGGQGTHAKIRVRIPESNLRVGGIGFGLAKVFEALPIGSSADLAVQLDQNTWNGPTSLDLHILDARPVV